MAHKPLRIGVVDQASSGWTAAAIYSKMILRSLSSVSDEANAEIYFLSSQTDPLTAPAKLIELASADYLPGERGIRRSLALGDKVHAWRGEARIRRLLKIPDASSPFSIAGKHGIDVLLPLLDVPPWPVASRLVGWIPDFQHVHLPEFFSANELAKRNDTMNRLGRHSTLIMLSSHAAKADFKSFCPQHVEKTRVLPFPSLLAFESLPEDPESTRNKFRLPEKFALVANQFWAHKNHQVIAGAAAKLRNQGLTPTIVMTGLPADPRDTSNSNFSALLQKIAAAGLNGQIIILGQVPYGDLINLMTMAALVIQPSRFEGWSTIVQDSKALGRPVICSDIPVHREQAPDAIGFFPWDDADRLAELIAANWEALPAGPDRARQQEALAGEQEFARQHARNLHELCREANAIKSSGTF